MKLLQTSSFQEFATKIWLYRFSCSGKIDRENLSKFNTFFDFISSCLTKVYDHDIVGLIIVNILIANASDAYATTRRPIHLQAGISVEVELSVIDRSSIHKIPLSQNVNMLIAKSLSCRSKANFTKSISNLPILS